MLLDSVSLVKSFTRRSVSFANVTDRVFAASLSDAFSIFASPAYFLLAKEFHVSVDEVSSCFSASFAGIAAFAYVPSVSLTEDI